MRFTQNLSNITHTNSYLKLLAMVLSALSFLSLMTIFILINAPPVLIDRSCDTTIIRQSDKAHTLNEIKVFLKEALSQRFDTKNEASHFLSRSVRQKRISELKKLKRQDILQQILVDLDKIQIEQNKAVVDSNRLFSVKDLRSAFKFKLLVRFASVKRTVLNPYGLIVSEISEIKEEKSNTPQTSK